MSGDWPALGVAHILEGSVQKSGDAVRVKCAVNQGRQMLSHLWAIRLIA